MGSNTNPEIKDFSNVDATNKAEQFIAFVDKLERLPTAKDVRETSYRLLHGQPGETMIDVGCGTGRAVIEMRERSIQAIGIDMSQEMIATARSRFPEGDFRLGSATDLPFKDHSVNLYRAERVYQYLPDPAAALREARRVLVPGGRIVLMDPDSDMWALDSDYQELTRALIRALSDSITNSWMGRRHYNLLQAAGFVDVTVEVKAGIYTDYAQDTLLPSMAKTGIAANICTQDEIEAWLADQQRRGEAGRFFMVMPLFIASASCP